MWIRSRRHLSCQKLHVVHHAAALLRGGRQVWAQEQLTAAAAAMPLLRHPVKPHSVAQDPCQHSQHAQSTLLKPQDLHKLVHLGDQVKQTAVHGPGTVAT